MAIKIGFFPWLEPKCDYTVAYCPVSFLPFSGLSFIFHHLWFRLSPSWQGPSFYIHLCWKQRHLLVSESIKNVADQCHYPELHLEDKGSSWIDALRSTEAELHFGLLHTCQRTLCIFPPKDHSQGKSYKSTSDCDRACNAGLPHRIKQMLTKILTARIKTAKDLAAAWTQLYQSIVSIGCIDLK